MAAVPTNSQVRQMVLQAMQSQAPEMYLSLQASGELERAVNDRVDLFDQTFSELSNQGTSKMLRSNLPFEEGVRLLEETDRSAVEQALSVALEFPSDATFPQASATITPPKAK